MTLPINAFPSDSLGSASICKDKDPYKVPVSVSVALVDQLMTEIAAAHAVKDQSPSITLDSENAMARTACAVDQTAKNIVETFGSVTANVLGGANSLFQFFGDYGPKLNTYREKVFLAVLPEQVFVKKLTDDEIVDRMQLGGLQYSTKEMIDLCRALLLKDAEQKDLRKGPNLSELTRPALGEEKKGEEQNSFDVIKLLRGILNRGEGSGLKEASVTAFENFIKNFGDQNIFAFLHGIAPGEKTEGAQPFLKLELTHMQKNTAGTIPNLDTTGVDLVEGQGSTGPKTRLLEFLFETTTTGYVLDPKQRGENGRFNSETLKKAIRTDLNLNLLRHKDGTAITPEELDFFAEEVRLFFWLYHAMDIELACSVTTMQELNQAKRDLAVVMGTPEEHAEDFAKMMLKSNAGIIAMQECGTEHAAALAKNFFNVAGEKTGTTIFLKKHLWKDVSLIIHDHLDEKGRGDKLVIVKATTEKTNRQFLLASLHGDAGNSKDALAKLDEVMQQYHDESQGNDDLELLIGGDFNTKTPKSQKELEEMAAKYGLRITDAGDTVNKMRALSGQTRKAGIHDKSQGDRVLTLLRTTEPLETLVGGKNVRPSDAKFSPNKENSSDHEIVQLTVKAIELSEWEGGVYSDAEEAGNEGEGAGNEGDEGDLISLFDPLNNGASSLFNYEGEQPVMEQIVIQGSPSDGSETVNFHLGALTPTTVEGEQGVSSLKAPVKEID